jgi:hypothetical protein
MALPDFCHEPTGLDLLALARANPADKFHRLILAFWMEGLGDPLAGFLRSLPHVRHFDQTDPITLAWLPIPDVIQLARRQLH